MLKVNLHDEILGFMDQLTILVEALDLIVVAGGPSPAGEEGEEEDGSVREKDI